MGKIRQPLPVKLFVGVLSSIPEIIPEVEKKLTGSYGAIDVRSPSYPFELTRYYDAEMGRPIQRWFLGFADLIEPAAIAGIKTQTNALEVEIAALQTGIKRPVNLDPGYIEMAKIILASTKNFYHRVLVSSGIYAEVTMHFESGAWHSFPWTFPDFHGNRYDDFFTSLRKTYRSQLRSRCPL